MPIVASKEFIPPVTCKCYRHLLTRKATDQVSRDLRGISEWLVINGGQQGDDVSRFAHGHIMLVVNGTEVRSYSFCIFRFIETSFLKAD